MCLYCGGQVNQLKGDVRALLKSREQQRKAIQAKAQGRREQVRRGERLLVEEEEESVASNVWAATVDRIGGPSLVV